MQAVQGPCGEVYNPFELGSVVKEIRSNGFSFPSIVFQISATPLIVPIQQINEEPDYVKEVKYRDRDAKWIAVTVELQPVVSRSSEAEGEKEIELKCGKEVDCSNYFQVLEVLPNDTEAGTKERLITQIASVASDVSGVLAPFFPATAGASGLGILFRNLFPPKSVAYQYAYIDSSSSFGWYFQQNKEDPETASLLGLHRGVALLKVNSKTVKVDKNTSDTLQRITVRYQVLSEWNKNPNPFTKFDLSRVGVAEICVPEQSKPDLKKLKYLTGFPAVISNEVANEILQVGSAEMDDLISNNLIQKVGENNVTRASLECFLGLTKKTDCPTIKNLEK